MTIKGTLFAFALSLAWAIPAYTQGFAGLGTKADGFERVVPGREIRFPDDMGAHPDFRIEWWYVTANLTAEDGQTFGAQWTLFRQATKPESPVFSLVKSKTSKWSSTEFWMGHAALTSADQHFSAEKVARGGIGQAGAMAAPFEAWIDDWRFSRTLAGGENKPVYAISAHGDTFSYNLNLLQTGPMVLQGDGGYSVKSDQGQASYYFSNPFLAASGTVTVGDKILKVTGDAWLDREWSSQPLASNQKGWDWFSLRFENGEKLMLFGLRSDASQPYMSATWISPDGQAEALDGSLLQMQPLRYSSVAGRQVPVEWSIKIPSKNVEVSVKALNDNSWMTTSISYWEGPVSATGSHKAVGYLEMTGY